MKTKKVKEKIVIRGGDLTIPNELHKNHQINYKGVGAHKNKKKYNRKDKKWKKEIKYDQR